MAKGTGKGQNKTSGSPEKGKEVTAFDPSKVTGLQTGNAMALGAALKDVPYENMFATLFMTSRTQVSYQSALALLDLNKKNKDHQGYTFFQTVALINILEIIAENPEKNGLVFDEDKINREEKDTKKKLQEKFKKYFDEAIKYLTSFDDHQYEVVGAKFHSSISTILEDFAMKSKDVDLVDRLLDSPLIEKLDRRRLEEWVKGYFMTYLKNHTAEAFTAELSQRDANGPIERGYESDELIMQCFSHFLTRYLTNTRYQLNNIKNETFPVVNTYYAIYAAADDVNGNIDYKDADSFKVCDSKLGEKRIGELFHVLTKAKPATYAVTIKDHMKKLIEEYNKGAEDNDDEDVT